MRALPLLLALVACKSGGSPKGPGMADEITYHTELAEDDGGEPAPTYDKGELEQAIITERGAEARAEQRIAELETQGDPDPVNDARADLTVRRRFLATLETCAATGHYCPPRLDDPAWNFVADSDADPKLDAPLRFDLDGWQKVSAELHGRACACRTQTCVDSINETIARLETRPMPEVQADETATTEITRARACIYRLLGKRPLPRLETAASE